MTHPSLKGKTAVVTGSSTGIGREIAKELARNGANVIIHGRSNSTELQNTAAEIKKFDVEVHSVQGDFSEVNSWDDFVGQAWAWKGNVDFWINNAGGDVLTGDWPGRELEEKLAFLFQVDVAATLLLSKSAGKRMQLQNCESPGTKAIINIGWDQAWQGMAGISGELFATTKGAIMSMSKSLAQTLAPQVRVNCIAPGWIRTQWGQQTSDYWNQRAINESLMGRWGTPNDVANVAAFLCSDSASFVSGQTISVNGGFKFNDDTDSTQNEKL